MVERLRQNRELQERLNEAEKLTLLGRFAAIVAARGAHSLNFKSISPLIKFGPSTSKAKDGAERVATQP